MMLRSLQIMRLGEFKVKQPILVISEIKVRLSILIMSKFTKLKR